MSESGDRKEYVVLGRIVGTATGWDEAGDHAILLYGLVTVVNARQIPDGDVNFDFERGLIEQYDSDGNITKSVDMITALVELPRKDAK